MMYMKRFGKGDTLPAQAQQIWLILAPYAVLKPTDVNGDSVLKPGLITYGDVVRWMGRPGAARVITRQLGIVGMYCRENDLPALNAIVVNKNTGMPGDDVVLAKSDDVTEEQKAVLEMDWFGLRPPTISQLRQVYERYPELRHV